MIRVRRGVEPPALREARWWRLARARELNGRLDPSDYVGYEPARDALCERQHNKCALCEYQIVPRGQSVEHFRPKERAEGVDWEASIEGASPEDAALLRRGLPPTRGAWPRVRWRSEPGYWWLTWSWDNLLFTCASCNSGFKKNRFPIANGAQRSTFDGPPWSEEDALLLDPTRVDPMDYIVFKNTRLGWVPVSRVGGDGRRRAEWTIAVLGLDDPHRVTHYAHCVERDFGSDFGTLRAARERGDEAGVRAAWNAIRRRAFAPHQSHQALLWDALDAALPSAQRQHLDLEHSRPGSGAEADPPVVDESPGGFDTLDADARWAVRALGDGRPPERLPRAIEHVLRCRPASVAELAGILGRAERTLDEAIRPLLGKTVRRRGDGRHELAR